MASKYTETMDNLRFSENEKAELVERLIASADGQEAHGPQVRQGIQQDAGAHYPQSPAGAGRSHTEAARGVRAFRRKPAHGMRAAAAAVAVVCVLAAGGGIAYATGGLVTLAQAFDDIFNGPPAKTEIIDKIGHPIDATATSNGITVSADAVIGDMNHLAIVYSIAPVDGTPLDVGQPIASDDGGAGLLPCMFGGQDTTVGFDIFDGMRGSSYFYDADPTDAAIQMVEQMEFSGEGSLVGRTARVGLRDLTLIGETEQDTKVIDGEWNLRFELGYEDSSVKFPSGQAFDLNGLAATVESLAVSPIAFTVKYAVSPVMPAIDEPSGRTSDKARAATEQYFDIGTVVFRMADGSAVSQDANMGGSARHDADVSHCETGFFFDQIIDPDEIVAIDFCGETITRGQG